MSDMAKKPFIDIVGVKALTKSSLLRIALGYIAVFWILPLISLVPQEITRVSLENFYLLLLVPVAMLVLGFAIGTEYGFCPVLMVFIAILAIPPALVFSFLPAWQYGLFYAVIYIAGNYLTETHKTMKRERRK